VNIKKSGVVLLKQGNFFAFLFALLLFLFSSNTIQAQKIREDGTTMDVPKVNKAKKTSKEISKKEKGNSPSSTQSKTAPPKGDNGEYKVIPPRTQGPRNEGALQKVNKNVEKNKSQNLSKHASGDQLKKESQRTDINYDGKHQVKGNVSQGKSKELAKNAGGDQKIPQSKMAAPKNNQVYKPFESKMQGPKNGGSDVVVREIDRNKQKDMATSTGDGPANYLANRDKMRSQKDKETATYSGNAPGNYLENRDQIRRQKDKETSTSTGDIPANFLAKREQLRQDKNREASTYTGTIPTNYLAERDKMRRQKDKEIATSTGDIPANYLTKRDQLRREKDKEMAKYTGNIPVNFLAKRDKMRRQKERDIANNKGDMLVRTIQKKQKAIRKKDKKMANYQGDIVVRRKRDGMHPSSVWKGGRMKNSYQAKEKYRKRILKKYGKNNNLEVPNYQKQKVKKPKVDMKESEIWY
jgi:hypothetical protein